MFQFLYYDAPRHHADYGVMDDHRKHPPVGALNEIYQPGVMSLSHWLLRMMF